MGDAKPRTAATGGESDAWTLRDDRDEGLAAAGCGSTVTLAAIIGRMWSTSLDAATAAKPLWSWPHGATRSPAAADGIAE
jgi:hypothetical protein